MRDTKPKKVYLIKDDKIVDEADSLAELSRKLGCQSSLVSRAAKYHKLLYGYVVSTIHPMDMLMNEIKERNKQPYQFVKR